VVASEQMEIVVYENEGRRKCVHQIKIRACCAIPRRRHAQPFTAGCHWTDPMEPSPLRWRDWQIHILSQFKTIPSLFQRNNLITYKTQDRAGNLAEHTQ